MDNLYSFTTGSMVYSSLVILLAGILFRIFKWYKMSASPVPLSIFPKPKSYLQVIKDTLFIPQVFEINKSMWLIALFVHLAAPFVVIYHLRLLLPGVNSPTSIHTIAGFIGVILLIAIIIMTSKKLIPPINKTTVPVDYMLMVLLAAVLLTGDYLHFFAQVPLNAYQEYVHSLLMFEPSLGTELMNSPYKSSFVLHIFLSNLFFIYFPFSKLMYWTVGSVYTNMIRRF